MKLPLLLAKSRCATGSLIEECCLKYMVE
jgi:hypothetical protein